MRAVMLDRLPLDQGDLDFEPLAAAFDDLVFHDATAAPQVAERIAGFQVVFTNKVVIDRAAIAGAEALRLVCITATGTNNVDLEAARELGVTVTNCRGYATPAVTQHVFAMIAGLTTRLQEYHRAVRAGRWQAAGTFCLLDYPIMELAGRCLGIVGYGDLGQSVAKVARAFGMEVRVAARVGGDDDRPDRIPLADLLPQVDVLSLHCPLTDATRHMIDAAALTALPKHALLINTARGALVNEVALAGALRAGTIGGAGIDVFTAEPPPPNHPLMASDLPNLIVSPHSAWGSVEARRRLLTQLRENVAAFVAGKPVRTVA